MNLNKPKSRAARVQSRILPLISRYFRVELAGEVDSIPDGTTQPCIFVMNHTALLGLEVYLLYGALHSRNPAAPRPVTTVWPPFLKMPILGGWYRTGGCIAMNVGAVCAALRSGKSVLILPEGPDATDVRDDVGPFHAGVLRVVKTLASDQRVPIVPLGWSGIDEANPWFVTTNSLAVRLLMKPVMPAFDFALLPRPPLLRPSKVVFVAGHPLRLTAEALSTESLLRGELERLRMVVRGLVADANQLRRQRIAASWGERVIHSAFRMHNVLWKRRTES